MGDQAREERPPRAPLDVPPRDDVRVTASPVRCPYCHDGVDAQAPDLLVCRACLARHHGPCWREGLRCGACGGAQALGGAVEFVGGWARGLAEVTPFTRAVWWVLTALGTTAAVAMVGAMLSRGAIGAALLPILALLGWLGIGLGWFSPRVRRVDRP